MTRREWLGAGLSMFKARQTADLLVPVHQVLDRTVQWDQARLRWFYSRLWPEASADLSKSGIKLLTTTGSGNVERPPYREPVVSGLSRQAINFVITAHIPLQWDGGRGLSGISMVYRGHVVCMLALSRARMHQLPFFSVNSCLHELLHVLMGDVFEERPTLIHREVRELRVDSIATRLWLFGDCGDLRQSTGRCLERLHFISARALATTSRN